MEIYPISNGVMLQHSVDMTETWATKIANEDISNRAQNFAKDLGMGITVDERIADTRGDKPRTVQCIIFSRTFANSASSADIELLRNDIKKFFEWLNEQKEEGIAIEKVHSEEVRNDDVDDWHKEQEEACKEFHNKLSSLLDDVVKTAILCSGGTITEDEMEFVKNLGEDITKTGEVPFMEATLTFKNGEGIAIKCPGAWLIKAITAYLEKYGNTGRKSSKHK